MDSKRLVITIALTAVMLAVVGMARIVAGQETVSPGWMAVRRETLAISYKNNYGTRVNMVGTTLAARAAGKAEVKHKNGLTRIKLEMADLGNPQAFGPYYTTFVLWAIAPEGQADNLAELSVKAKTDLEVTTNLQTFGLIITAEPHSAVKLPGPMILAENALRGGTEAEIQSSRIEYSGDPGTLYAAPSTSELALDADYNTPLLVLGARRAVDIARRAGARHYAESELREAQVKLVALEQTWPERRNDQEELNRAHEVMRIAEHARTQAVERDAQARLADERRDAVFAIVSAQSDVERLQNEAERAKVQAATDRNVMGRPQIETTVARAEPTQNETDKAKANEESAATAERALMSTQVVKKRQSDMRRGLYISLSEIFETRREARGLIVNLSDDLFDFNQATLKPGAREKLGKLAGILLAYPGAYRVQIEGHTDSVGSPAYNQKLSEDRAEAVHVCLISSRLPVDWMAAVRGFGMIKPVATNETPEGRQANRRVEIVISDTEK